MYVWTNICLDYDIGTVINIVTSKHDFMDSFYFSVLLDFSVCASVLLNIWENERKNLRKCILRYDTQMA